MTDDKLLETANRYAIEHESLFRVHLRSTEHLQNKWLAKEMASFAAEQINLAVQAERKAIAERLDHVCICSDSSHMASELLKVQEELRND